jgi:peptide deformylase
MMPRELEDRSRMGVPHAIVARPLSLRIHPDPVLRSVCHPVEQFDNWLTDVLDEMLALMRVHQGIGLAAPQVGISRRFFVAQIGRQSIAMINPMIVSRSGSGHRAEGCLSLPGASIEVRRVLQIEVEGFDPRGRRQRHSLEGMWARVAQHEIDHLDGILICDHER